MRDTGLQDQTDLELVAAFIGSILGTGKHTCRYTSTRG